MPRYNVGDVVCVRPFDEISKSFIRRFNSGSGDTMDNGIRFSASMKGYCGGRYVVATAITRMYAKSEDERDDRYRLVGCDGWWFSNSMLSDPHDSGEVNVNYSFDELFADSEVSGG